MMPVKEIGSLPVAQAGDLIRWLHEGKPFETCVIGPKRPTSNLWEGRANGKKPIVAGWFIDADIASKLACQIEATGVYVTLNPVEEALLSRAESRLKAGVDRTPDRFISRIKNLLIDVDPIRPPDVSSSNDEHETALKVALNIRDDLREEGWPEPIYGDSGNGAHLIYALDLPNEDESKELVKGVLVYLSERYKDQLAGANLDMDQKVFNPARLTKLYGTVTRKGDNTASRPHRLSKIIDLPQRQPVPIELLKKLTPALPVKGKSIQKGQGESGYLDVPAYLQHYGREIVKTAEAGTSTLYCLEVCIFDSDHSGNESAIGQKADGGLFYQCFHNSCKYRTWKDAREIISGQDSLGKFMVGGRAASFSSTPSPQKGGGVQAPVFTSSLLCKDHANIRNKMEDAMMKSGFSSEEMAYVLDKMDNPDKPTILRPFTDEVTDWIMTSKGQFQTYNIHQELNLTSRDLKKQANEVCRRLVEKGKITQCGDKRGCYRVIEESEEMDWQSADITNIYDVKWPFGLEKLVKIFPGNIVVVAGEKNAGKSAFLYNFIKLNQNKHKVVYFNSEASKEELKLRLSAHEDILVNNWNFKVFKRSHGFPEAIVPNRLNIIDYFEFNDEAKFYEIAGEIRKIHDKLKKGICVIALQKKKGAEFGRGGDFSREKARMYLTMGGGKLTIVDGKIWAGEHNPNGRVFDYKLWGGWKFIEYE